MYEYEPHAPAQRYDALPRIPQAHGPHCRPARAVLHRHGTVQQGEQLQLQPVLGACRGGPGVVKGSGSSKTSSCSLSRHSGHDRGGEGVYGFRGQGGGEGINGFRGQGGGEGIYGFRACQGGSRLKLQANTNKNSNHNTITITTTPPTAAAAIG